MTKNVTLEVAVRGAGLDQAMAQEKCDKFAKSFAKSPQHAMEWSMEAFEAAAVLKVTAAVLAILTDKADVSDEERVQEVARTSLREVMRRSRYAEGSSSASSNISERSMLVAWSKVSEEFNSRV